MIDELNWIRIYITDKIIISSLSVKFQHTQSYLREHVPVLDSAYPNIQAVQTSTEAAVVLVIQAVQCEVDPQPVWAEELSLKYHQM